MALNFTAIDQIIEKHHRDPRALITVLLDVQDTVPQNYISEDTAKYISAELGVSMTEIYEVLTFYSALHDKPKGKYLIQLCDSTVCRVNKSNSILDILQKELGIQLGDTTPDNLFTLEHTACFGACDISPAMRVNQKVYGNLDAVKVRAILAQLRGSADE